MSLSCSTTRMRSWRRAQATHPKQAASPRPPLSQAGVRAQGSLTELAKRNGPAPGSQPGRPRPFPSASHRPASLRGGQARVTPMPCCPASHEVSSRCALRRSMLLAKMQLRSDQQRLSCNCLLNDWQAKNKRLRSKASGGSWQTGVHEVAPMYTISFAGSNSENLLDRAKTCRRRVRMSGSGGGRHAWRTVEPASQPETEAALARLTAWASSPAAPSH